MAIHPAVCGQDTLVRKSFTFIFRILKLHLHAALSCHACLYRLLELGHLALFVNLAFSSLGQPSISPACCSPDYLRIRGGSLYHLGGTKWYLRYSADTTYSTETLCGLLGFTPFFLAVKALFFTLELSSHKEGQLCPEVSAFLLS